MPGQPSPMTTAVKYEPRRTDAGRMVLRPASSSVKFLSNDGIILTIHLPDIDLAQIGAYFVFPVAPTTQRVAGDPLSSLPPRLGQILSQSVTPLILITEFIAYVTATDLTSHEGPAPPLDIVAEQQASIAMRSLASQQGDDANKVYTSEQSLDPDYRKRLGLPRVIGKGGI